MFEKASTSTCIAPPHLLFCNAGSMNPSSWVQWHSVRPGACGCFPMIQKPDRRVKPHDKLDGGTNGEGEESDNARRGWSGSRAAHWGSASSCQRRHNL